MAGPTASLLLPHKVDDGAKNAVEREIRRRSSKREGSQFWVDKQPFLVAFGPEYPEELEELAISSLPGLLGWEPRDVVTFCAMCNGDVDHRILAELCLRLSEEQGWLVDFNGQLAGQRSMPRDRASEGVRIEDPDGLSGTLFATSYLTANGDYATSHFGDADLLGAWLEHPSFRMVK